MTAEIIKIQISMIVMRWEKKKEFPRASVPLLPIAGVFSADRMEALRKEAGITVSRTVGPALLIRGTFQTATKRGFSTYASMEHGRIHGGLMWRSQYESEMNPLHKPELHGPIVAQAGWR